MYNEVPEDPVIRRHWVNFKLKCAGKTLHSVAQEAGVKPATLHQVFFRPYPKMEKALARALGIAEQELFPERYQGSRG